MAIMNKKHRKITVQNNEEYISLTDMVKNFGDDVMIYQWMRNRNTVEFITAFKNTPIERGGCHGQFRALRQPAS